MLSAPAVLSYEKIEANNAYIVGPLIATVAIVAMAEAVRSTRWLNLLLGVWLLLSPWLLNSGEAAKVNDTIVGIIVACLSTVKGKLVLELGGGWKAIFRDS
jgi:uncharacterized membrane protein